MNPFRDASPRPRCTKCGMRNHKCLCKKPPSGEKREPPNLDKTPGQTRLDVGDHAGSRVAYWMRWMRTTGIREGLTVEPDKNQSSQDQRRAYHGVEGYRREESSEAKQRKTVVDGKAAAKTMREGLNNPRGESAESGVAENEVRGPQQLSTFYVRPLHGLEEE